MISGLTLLIMIWATGVLVFLLAKCPDCDKELKAASIKRHRKTQHGAEADGDPVAQDDDDDEIPHRFGGELSALERRYKAEPRKLFIAKAEYDRGHKHHKDIVRTPEGITLKIGPQDDKEDS